MSAMKTIVQMVHLPLECRHVEGLSFSGLDQSWWFPHTTNYESGQSSRICGKGIHIHHIVDGYRLHMWHDHCRNAWKHCLGIVFCANNEACHVPNKGLISPQILSFPCNQLLTSVIWILPLVNIYIGGQIQSFKLLMWYLLGWQRCRLSFILPLQDKMDLSALSM